MTDLSLQSFLTLFDYKKKKSKETFKEVDIELISDTFKEIDKAKFIAAVKFLNPRDKLQLSFIIGDNDSIDYYLGGEIDSFLEELNQKVSISDDEEIKIQIVISKSISDKAFSVYNYNEILNFFESLALQDFFYILNQLIKPNGFVIGEFQTIANQSTTSSIWFVNKGYTGTPVIADRASKINKAKSACHSNFLTDFVLIPDDFFIETSGCLRIKKLFDLLATISSLAFLYDISVFNKNIFEYKLNGYKSINAEIDISNLEVEGALDYYKIYSWVYNSGNFIDKLGLARNIISLHLENINSIDLKGDPFQSIQSSYKIYEKQNIKQYIEIRNKISDQLLSFHDRANKIIEAFATGFQKSALALITFYISTIILKIITKDKLADVFTLGASILSSAFIFCCIIYFFVTRWETKEQEKRFIDNYQNIKNRYLDLLDSDDIERILNNDKEFNSDLKFIRDKRKAYTWMWVSFLSILLVATWILYFVYK